MRNNRPEAVMMSIDEYERIYEAFELLEHLDTYKTIKEREQTPVNEYMSHEDILQKLKENQE
ncbi:hypothetical protein QUF70_02315 [Desulfobacterales bacterium HSG17]|nr:hypothetical protein [Desulfobacterales bacterium HSG17]